MSKKKTMPENPESLNLRSVFNGKKFFFEFTNGATFQEVKMALSEFRDHVAVLERQYHQEVSSKEKVQDPTVLKGDTESKAEEVSPPQNES